jgi:hypothetical protein
LLRHRHGYSARRLYNFVIMIAKELPVPGDLAVTVPGRNARYLQHARFLADLFGAPVIPTLYGSGNLGVITRIDQDYK